MYCDVILVIKAGPVFGGHVCQPYHEMINIISAKVFTLLYTFAEAIRNISRFIVEFEDVHMIRRPGSSAPHSSFDWPLLVHLVI